MLSSHNLLRVVEVLRFEHCNYISSVPPMRFSLRTHRDPALGYPVETFVDSYDVLACQKCCLHCVVLNDASRRHPPRNLLRLPPLEIPIRKNVRKGLKDAKRLKNIQSLSRITFSIRD